MFLNPVVKKEKVILSIIISLLRRLGVKQSMVRQLFFALILVFMALLQGCTHNRFSYQDFLANHNMQSFWVDGDKYRHWLVYKPGKSDSTLRVYIGGDGSPWVLGRYVNDDPTPKNPISLKLMALDPNASLFLGRPCYHGLEAVCGPSLWTEARYSKDVAKSMISALKSFLKSGSGNSFDRVDLIGFSGGGALATIIAQDFEASSKLVTIAGNLDHNSWTQSFGYLPLVDSVNPIDIQDIKNLPALHVGGEQDRNIDISLTREFVERHGGRLLVVPEVDHACCWVEVWPDILNEIEILD